MAIKVNQSKQYRIYIKESKSWVDINKEFYTNYYRDINAYRKRPAGTWSLCLPCKQALFVRHGLYDLSVCQGWRPAFSR